MGLRILHEEMPRHPGHHRRLILPRSAPLPSDLADVSSVGPEAFDADRAGLRDPDPAGIVDHHPPDVAEFTRFPVGGLDPLDLGEDDPVGVGPPARARVPDAKYTTREGVHDRKDLRGARRAGGEQEEEREKSLHCWDRVGDT